MRIGQFDTQDSVFVIAEIGNNHEGDAGLADEMIHLAADAGAHAVKFQTIRPDRLVSSQQTERIAQLERFRLSNEQFSKLAETARAAGVAFLSTPFHLDAVDELDPLVPAFKIASGDNDFIPLLEAVAAKGKPVLLSCGLADLATITASQETVRRIWHEHGNGAFIALLHCVASYPTPLEEANLNAIRTLAPLADVVGYSDHTLGIEAAVASVAVGARIIEKHFTIDKNHSEFRDHQLSADAAELRQLCRRVEELNQMLGDGAKRELACEDAMRQSGRRSIAAARSLDAGTVLRAEDITWLRPGGGLPPGREGEVIGRSLRRAVRAGDAFRLEDLAV